MSIYRFLLRLRELRDINIADVASVVGVHQATLGRWEGAVRKRKAPTASHDEVVAWAEALGVDEIQAARINQSGLNDEQLDELAYRLSREIEDVESILEQFGL